MRLRWWVATTVCWAGLGVGSRLTVDRTVGGLDRPAARPELAVTEPTVRLDSIWPHAPFRPDRLAPSERYTVPTSRPIDAEPALRERPAWVLTGILVGENPTALFEGVDGPGSTTRLLGVGDTVGRFRLTAIRGDTAVVSTDEDEWSFGLETPWR